MSLEKVAIKNERPGITLGPNLRPLDDKSDSSERADTHEESAPKA